MGLPRATSQRVNPSKEFLFPALVVFKLQALFAPMSESGHGRPIRLGEWYVRSYLNCGCAKTRVATPASGQFRTHALPQTPRTDAIRKVWTPQSHPGGCRLFAQRGRSGRGRCSGRGAGAGWAAGSRGPARPGFGDGDELPAHHAPHALLIRPSGGHAVGVGRRWRRSLLG
jgi:hypothetical protein